MYCEQGDYAAKITDKILELCRGIILEVVPIYVPVESAT